MANNVADIKDDDLFLQLDKDSDTNDVPMMLRQSTLFPLPQNSGD